MQVRKTWKQVDGVLLLDKPLGLTSNAALQKARGLFSAAKGGHTGTLDPLATGLLPLGLACDEVFRRLARRRQNL